MDKYCIATGISRNTKIWKNTNISWDELVKRLEKTQRTSETQGEYKNMTKTQQDSIKDVGGFVGGRLKGGSRKRGCVEARSLLTLDADFAGEDFCEAIDMFAEYTYCIYSTHKHTAEKPRLRLVIPLSRECSADEYEAVARKIAENIGIDMFDDTTYQPQRLMYWPSTSIDGEYIFRHCENKLLDVSRVLAQYDDWHDVTQWPCSSRTVKSKERLLKKQEDPTIKNGIIGAFCRTYDVHSAIEKFLPDVYMKCVQDDRYTYINGSTAAGLVVYEDGKFAYSNHATDPAGGQLCNAFDLVRIHKFGDSDNAVKDGTPTVKMPSYTAMMDFAAHDDEVRKLMHKERELSCAEDFKGIIVEDYEEENSDWILELNCDSKGNNLPTIDNCLKILKNDKRLKGRIAYNTFTQRHTATGRLPWNEKNCEREWTDTDDAGLRHYIESMYGIKSRTAVADGWSLVSKSNEYNPVFDYLEGLVWDGKNRVETYFIDYLGAENCEYVRAVTRKMLAAAAARIFIPGVKYDNVVVLVGSQGVGKSYSISRLGKNWFSDTLTTVQGKEAYEQLQGVWIVEIAELSALRKSEVEAIKQFISKSEDTYRAAYAHHTETRKRQCVFAGTTNRREFLRDETGNRRFLPIDVNPEKASKDIFTELTDYEVDQIWAEAVQIYRNGEKLYMDTSILRELSEKEQKAHFEESPLTGEVVKYLETLLPENWADMSLSDRRLFLNGNDFGVKAEGTVRREKVCPLEVWCEAFGGEKKDFNYQRCKEIKDIIVRIDGWETIKSNSRFGALYGSQRGFQRVTVDKSVDTSTADKI